MMRKGNGWTGAICSARASSGDLCTAFWTGVHLKEAGWRAGGIRENNMEESRRTTPCMNVSWAAIGASCFDPLNRTNTACSEPAIKWKMQLSLSISLDISLDIQHFHTTKAITSSKFNVSLKLYFYKSNMWVWALVSKSSFQPEHINIAFDSLSINQASNYISFRRQGFEKTKLLPVFLYDFRLLTLLLSAVNQNRWQHLFIIQAFPDLSPHQATWVSPVHVNYCRVQGPPTLSVTLANCVLCGFPESDWIEESSDDTFPRTAIPNTPWPGQTRPDQ